MASQNKDSLPILQIEGAHLQFIQNKPLHIFLFKLYFI